MGNWKEIKNRITDEVTSDWNRVQSQISANFVKRNAYDISAKYLILLINTFGKKNLQSYLCIDEIKNRSMADNIKESSNQIRKSGMDCGDICFYQIRRGKTRTGIMKNLCLILLYCLVMIPAIVISLFQINVSMYVIKSTIFFFYQFIRGLRDNYTFILMTDHHFFSTIIANVMGEKSYVLQHGLIKEKEYYYPIRAGHFLAWGIRTKELLENDRKITVTGTYKFNNIGESIPMDLDIKKATVLFCISSLDKRIVKTKIITLIELANSLGFTLAIKDHPGSMFDIKGVVNTEEIKIYKNEKIEDLKFDLAITENSTVIMDLVYLNKVFILYDSVDEYFRCYGDAMLHGNTKSEIQECLKRIKDYDYQKMRNLLISKEVNDGVCNIVSTISCKE